MIVLKIVNRCGCFRVPPQFNMTIINFRQAHLIMVTDPAKSCQWLLRPGDLIPMAESTTKVVQFNSFPPE